MQDVMYLQYSALRYGCLHRWIGSALNTTLGFVSANATADSSIKALRIVICREEREEEEGSEKKRTNHAVA